MTVTNLFPSLTHELSIYFPSLVPCEEGRNRAALEDTWHPENVNGLFFLILWSIGLIQWSILSYPFPIHLQKSEKFLLLNKPPFREALGLCPLNVLFRIKNRSSFSLSLCHILQRLEPCWLPSSGFFASSKYSLHA